MDITIHLHDIGPLKFCGDQKGLMRVKLPKSETVCRWTISWSLEPAPLGLITMRRSNANWAAGPALVSKRRRRLASKWGEDAEAAVHLCADQRLCLWGLSEHKGQQAGTWWTQRLRRIPSKTLIKRDNSRELDISNQNLCYFSKDEEDEEEIVNSLAELLHWMFLFILFKTVLQDGCVEFNQSELCV